jgi:hypothetical protein
MLLVFAGLVFTRIALLIIVASLFLLLPSSHFLRLYFQNFALAELFKLLH